jgi:hypothetical protein
MTRSDTRNHLNTSPLFVPVPTFHSHIVTSSQDEGEGGVNSQTSNVIGMSLKRSYLFPCRDIVYSQLKIIRSGNELDIGVSLDPFKNGEDLPSSFWRYNEHIEQEHPSLQMSLDPFVSRSSKSLLVHCYPSVSIPDLHGSKVDVLETTDDVGLCRMKVN